MLWNLLILIARAEAVEDAILVPVRGGGLQTSVINLSSGLTGIGYDDVSTENVQIREWYYIGISASPGKLEV
jgi:hypothetical protein